MPTLLPKLRDEDAEQDQRSAAHPCEADNAIYFRAHGIIAEELGDNVVKVPVDPPALIEIGMGWPLKESLSPAAVRSSVRRVFYDIIAP